MLGSGQRVTARGVQAEARLLAAAAQLFGRKPFDEITVAELSRAGEVQTSSFYQRFGSKEALAAAVYRAALARRTGRLRDALAGVPKRAREEVDTAVRELLRDPDARLLLNLDHVAQEHEELRADPHALREMAAICAEWCRKTNTLPGGSCGWVLAVLLDGATRAAWTTAPDTIDPEAEDSLVAAIWRAVVPAMKARADRHPKGRQAVEPDLLSRVVG